MDGTEECQFCHHVDRWSKPITFLVFYFDEGRPSWAVPDDGETYLICAPTEKECCQFGFEMAQQAWQARPALRERGPWREVFFWCDDRQIYNFKNGTGVREITVSSEKFAN